MDVDCHHVIDIDMVLSNHSTFIAFRVEWTATSNLLEEILEDNDVDEDMKYLYRERHKLCLYVSKKDLIPFINSLKNAIQKMEKELNLTP